MQAFLPWLTRQGHVCRLFLVLLCMQAPVWLHTACHTWSSSAGKLCVPLHSCTRLATLPTMGRVWPSTPRGLSQGRKGRDLATARAHARAEPGIRPVQARWRRPRSPSAGRPPTSSTAPGTARARPRRATSSALCCPPSWSLCGAPWSCPWSCTGGEPASDGGHHGCCGMLLSGHARCPVQLRNVHVVVPEQGGGRMLPLPCDGAAVHLLPPSHHAAAPAGCLQRRVSSHTPCCQRPSCSHSMLHVGLPVPAAPHIMRSSRGCRWSGVRCARVSGPA